MILMNFKADNLYLFKDFELKLSYPKKIVNSGIAEENLENYPNFRYKKTLIVMGANATGKTRLGKVLMGIFNFIEKRESIHLTQMIEDTSKPAAFTIDIVLNDEKNRSDYCLYRIETKVAAKSKPEYLSSDIQSIVKFTTIGHKDNYEKCAERLNNDKNFFAENYISELEKVPRLTWMFRYTIDDEAGNSIYTPVNEVRYCSILKTVLKALDPRIDRVQKVKNTQNTFVVSYSDNGRTLVVSGNKVVSEGFSSGTKECIGVAQIIAGIKAGGYNFFYCDEKFSHVHSDMEKAFISILISCLKQNDQLFITTHNKEVFDMNLPRHAFVFLKRDSIDNSITCVYPDEYLKRNTDSLKNAVDNDVFGTSPDIDTLFESPVLLSSAECSAFTLWRSKK